MSMFPLELSQSLRMSGCFPRPCCRNTPSDVILLFARIEMVCYK
jgi:hypothetical protein